MIFIRFIKLIIKLPLLYKYKRAAFVSANPHCTVPILMKIQLKYNIFNLPQIIFQLNFEFESIKLYLIYEFNTIYGGLSYIPGVANQSIAR